MAELRLEGISKAYGHKQILHDVSFQVEHGSFYALLGPSGCGKTTILRTIAGFVPPDTGEVLVNGRAVTHLPPEQRNMGLVFQNYALFPHMTVFENVAFGLRMRRLQAAAVREKVARALELVQMEAMADRRPAQLSGGQQQRVALARALVIEPQLLLLDEPLSALDRRIRQEVQTELKRIQRETGVTALIVTHDQEEALFLADRLLVLDQGRVRQIGTPWEVYQTPADTFVATFLGSANVLDGVLRRRGDEWLLEVGRLALPAPDPVVACGSAAPPGDGTPVRFAIRPEWIALAPAGAAPGLPGEVREVGFSGPFAQVSVAVGEVTLGALLLSPSAAELRPGAAVAVRIDPAGIRLYPQAEAGGKGA